MITLEKINKSFSGKNPILKNVSFNISKGDSVVVIGQSGVGKSVLLKHINRLLEPDSGKVMIDKILLNNLPYKDLQNLRRKMAMVFQFGALFDSMNIEENILLGLKNIDNLKFEDMQSRVENSLDLVNLSGINHKMPSEISGGMKKRVGIARAIAMDPEYILYDEPTTGLDPITTDRINLLIKKISQKRKVTSVLVTHNMRTLKKVANKVIMLHEGNIIFNGNVDELYCTKDKFIQYFINGEKNGE